MPGHLPERSHLPQPPGPLTADGRTLLFNQVLSGGGSRYVTGIRDMDGSAPVRLGEGFAYALSPDGRWALGIGTGPALEVVLLPTGAGQTEVLSEGLPEEFYGASWLPDSRGFVFSGGSPGGTARLFEQPVDGGPPRPLTDVADDLEMPVVSPGGESIAAIDNLYGDIVLLSREDGSLRDLPGAEEGERPIQWSSDGRSLYVYDPRRLPVSLFEIDAASGERRRVREIVLADMTGLDGGVILDVTPDARACAYSFQRFLDDLYLVEGLR